MTAPFMKIEEILAASIMTGIPSLIVEGVDDIRVYDELASIAGRDVEVFAIENVKDFAEGCAEVIRAIDVLRLLPISNDELKKNILAIIDADVRRFRGECPVDDLIFVLKYYSIETHFVSADNFGNVMKKHCLIPSKLLTDQLVGGLMAEIEIKLLELYYPSLEALKGSLDPSYQACVGYSLDFGAIHNNSNIQVELSSKKSDLDKFAHSLALSQSIDVIKVIAKGKWVHDFFVRETSEVLKTLSDRCRNSQISVCQSCISNRHNKCLYRVRNFHIPSLTNFSRGFFSLTEFNYIFNKIRSIA